MALNEEVFRPDSSTLKRWATPEFLEICPPLVAEMFHHWDGLRKGRLMPQRADFHPEAVVGHLPGILLIDVEGVDSEGIGIYRYRVVGTEEVRLRGSDPTGKLVNEGYFAATLEDALDCYETIRRCRSFLYETVEFVSQHGRWRSEASVILPFSEDGETVSQIMVYSVARSAKDS